jgi:hypothetical protein
MKYCNTPIDVVKDCYVKYHERISLYVPDLKGDIVKDAK